MAHATTAGGLWEETPGLLGVLVVRMRLSMVSWVSACMFETDVGRKDDICVRMCYTPQKCGEQET